MFDNRAMSRMDPDTRFVHTLLEDWGRWSYDSTLRAYPPITLLGRMIKYGPQGASHVRPPLEMPKHVAAVDGAIAKLNQPDKIVVITYYTRDEPIEVCAIRCRLRLRQFQNVLSRARRRIVFSLPLHDCVQNATSLPRCESVL